MNIYLYVNFKNSSETFSEYEMHYLAAFECVMYSTKYTFKTKINNTRAASAPGHLAEEKRECVLSEEA